MSVMTHCWVCSQCQWEESPCVALVDPATNARCRHATNPGCDAHLCDPCQRQGHASRCVVCGAESKVGNTPARMCVDHGDLCAACGKPI